MQLSIIDFRDILERVKFPGYVFHVGTRDGREEPYLQVKFSAPNGVQAGRKWRLSKFMTKGEVVQTALKAVLTATEHEVREFFTYRGRAIFGPHYDIDKLVEICDDPRSVEERQ